MTVKKDGASLFFIAARAVKEVSFSASRVLFARRLRTTMLNSIDVINIINLFCNIVRAVVSVINLCRSVVSKKKK